MRALSMGLRPKGWLILKMGVLGKKVQSRSSMTMTFVLEAVALT